MLHGDNNLCLWEPLGPTWAAVGFDLGPSIRDLWDPRVPLERPKVPREVKMTSK